MMRMVSDWTRLPKEIVYSPSLKMFDVRLEGNLSNRFYWKVILLVAGELQHDLSRPLPNQTILLFYIYIYILSISILILSIYLFLHNLYVYICNMGIQTCRQLISKFQVPIWMFRYKGHSHKNPLLSSYLKPEVFIFLAVSLFKH